MCAGCCWTALLLSLTAVGPITASEFPYTAEVTAEDVYIRSGPGANYYPTAKLQRGDQVEIYRQDPGGWCVFAHPATVSVGSPPKN